ncbi:MAG: MXAN_5808 family serine peptidase [Anaeromyxobacteraceae bacterium]
MIRPARLVATLSATLALASGVTYLAYAKAQAEPRTAQLAVRDVPSSTADDPNYPLEKLPVFSRAVHYVHENYVDASRIDPKGMVVAALDMVEKTVAEVMVDGDVKSGKLTLTVGSASRPVDISGVKTIFDVRVVMGEVMGFVQQHLVAHKNLRDIEYAATNGMLSTLDPHSILLDPKNFREMRLQTKGEFGGLGFVIAMRDGNLTVVRVLKNTPAQKAGIKPKDVIAKIGEQSTVNMDLQDAVDRLRGRPATRVAISVVRPGTPEPRRYDLAREVINVETVPQAKLLEGGIGYVKLSQFSANTTRDLAAAVAAQKAQNGGQLKGFVLDLRGNPGGLLEQAINVSDLFLSEGVIVKTVGGGNVHEVKEAHADRDDLVNLPLVVIVNNSSASASEIVAGALKNNNRALVIGRQTFGKGSVQVLYDFSDPTRPNEDAALKLTIAQYLTPGDVSIQEVGVTPDVLLLPGRALKDAVNYFAPPRSLGEVDLEKHFTNPADASLSAAELEKRAQERRNRTEKASLELRYLLDEKEDTVAKAMKADAKREQAARAHGEAGVGADELTPEQQEDEDADANPDELVEDYQIRFAREFLARSPFPDRPRLLEAAKGFVTEKHDAEGKRLEAKLAELGVDWSSAGAQGAPRAVVSVSPAPGKRFVAGETLPLTVTVENKGDGAFRRLRGWTLVDKTPLLDRREFVFGLVKPGEKRSWTVPVKLPKGMDTRHDEVRLHFEDEGGRAPPEAVTAIDVIETQKPLFAFSTQVDDDATGNGDGLVQRGEEVTLRVDVKNEGQGASGEKTYVSLKNLGDEKTFIKKGRVVVGSIKPGEVKTALMQVELKKGLKADVMPLRVMIVDEKLDEYVSERIEFPVAAEGKARAVASGAMRVKVPQSLLAAGASAEAPAIAVAKKGAVLPVAGRIGDLVRVEWAKGRYGWAPAADLEPAQGARAATTNVAEVWQREPPRIAFTSPNPAQGAPVVEGEKLHVEGTASVPAGVPGARTRLRDVFIFVNDQKVFFKVVPESNGATKVDFAADVPLKPGNNSVTVFAREDEEFQARRTFFVNRRGGAEVAQGVHVDPPVSRPQ